MKKTLIALLALAGVAMGANIKTEEVWSIDFGTEYGTTGFSGTGITFSSGSNPDGGCGVWDVDAVAGGAQLTTGGGRIHLKFSSGLGTWKETDFSVSITLTMPETLSANGEWPVLMQVSTGNEPKAVISPYTKSGYDLHLDGHYTDGGTVQNTFKLEENGKYTLTLTHIDGVTSLYASEWENGVAGTATLIQTRTQQTVKDDENKTEIVGRQIYDILLSGTPDSKAQVSYTVHNVTWSKVIPEPATATLSLLALAGLAARRRRRA